MSYKSPRRVDSLQQATSAFFKLPREVRDSIYHYVCLDTRLYFRHRHVLLLAIYTATLSEIDFKGRFPSSRISWLLTSRQVFAEVTQQFHRRAWFGIVTSPAQNSLGDWWRRNIVTVPEHDASLFWQFPKINRARNFYLDLSDPYLHNADHSSNSTNWPNSIPNTKEPPQIELLRYIRAYSEERGKLFFHLAINEFKISSYSSSNLEMTTLRYGLNRLYGRARAVRFTVVLIFIGSRGNNDPAARESAFTTLCNNAAEVAEKLVGGDGDVRVIFGQGSYKLSGDGNSMMAHRYTRSLVVRRGRELEDDRVWEVGNLRLSVHG